MNIGDKIIEVDLNRKGKKTELTVTKVGRKWLTLSNDVKVEIGSLQCEGNSYGRSYYTELSLVVHEANNELRDLLSEAIYRTTHFSLSDTLQLIHLLKSAMNKEKTSTPT